MADMGTGRVFPRRRDHGLGSRYGESGVGVGRLDSGVQVWPFQSTKRAGASSLSPSHQTSPSSVSATLVKTQFPERVARAFGLSSVPGQLRKIPPQDLLHTADHLHQFHPCDVVPNSFNLHPGSDGIISPYLFCHKLMGKLLRRIWFHPGGVTLTMSMCSANQPSSRAIVEAIRRAKHFLPRRALPPYPEP